MVSRTSALAEILTTDSGATADNDPGAIAHAVSSIISRPEALRRINARRRAEQFTWPRAAEGMLRRHARDVAGRSLGRYVCQRADPASVDHAFGTVPISFLAAIQTGLFRNVGDLAYLPVATTGNLLRSWNRPSRPHAVPFHRRGARE